MDQVVVGLAMALRVSVELEGQLLLLVKVVLVGMGITKQVALAVGLQRLVVIVITGQTLVLLVGMEALELRQVYLAHL